MIGDIIEELLPQVQRLMERYASRDVIQALLAIALDLHLRENKDATAGLGHFRTLCDNIIRVRLARQI